MFASHSIISLQKKMNKRSLHKTIEKINDMKTPTETQTQSTKVR